MKLKKEIVKIIEQENKKDPYTDDKLAGMLDTSRENITSIRKELNIPDSRKRREPGLIKDIKCILAQDAEMRMSELTLRLREEGYDVSRSAVAKAFNKINDAAEDTAKEIYPVSKKTDDSFNSLIGYNGSLRSCVVQAKASILYPPFGLPTLITGESGAGKTYFVECMYKFAVNSGVLDATSPFKVFNCADYADNPQLLLSILFGYKKGAFTGADKDTEGIVEQANGGVLFLDEIHRLPPKGQEILFSILDSRKFRRLGETFDERNANIIFTGATTEDIQSSLLLSFRRRIPMIISIPPLEEREISEKVELVRYFFQQECNRINNKIYVESKVIETLSLKKYPGNVGQLKSQIQVICARAFMKNINNRNDVLSIELDDLLYLENFLQDILIKDEKLIYRIRKMVKDVMFIPQEKYIANQLNIGDSYISEGLYEEIERKYSELKSLKFDDKNVEEILSRYIINQFEKIGLSDRDNEQKFSLDKLKEIINADILVMVKELQSKLHSEFADTRLNENVFTHLAIHLQEAVKRIENKKSFSEVSIKNFRDIKNKHPREYEIAQNFADMLGQRLNIQVPEEEIGFIALYIKTAIENNPIKNNVGVIVICHGHIAREIVNVVDKLLNEDFPIAVDMPLDESPISTYDRVCKIVNIADKGNGILFLVDMGSLNNIGDMITSKFGIKTRTIDRIDLLTVMEAVRKASFSNNLDDIYFSLIRQKYEYNYPYMMLNTGKPKAVLAVCLTGEGTALRINETLKSAYANLKVFPVGIFDPDLEKKIEGIQKEFDIAAAIGTINPEIKGINFIPFDSELFVRQGKPLELLLNTESSLNASDLIDEEFIIIDPVFKSNEDLIETMCSLLINKGYIKKDYYKMVIKREEMQPTFFKWGVAIPHGDPQGVIRSSIVFARLMEPVKWGAGKVNMVCLPAIKYGDKQVISQLFKVFSNKKLMESLSSVRTGFEFKTILLQNLQGGSK